MVHSEYRNSNKNLEMLNFVPDQKNMQVCSWKIILSITICC